MITIYQIAIGNIPIDVQLLMDGVSDFAKLNGYGYELIKTNAIYNNDIILSSDTLRIELLAENPDAIYCDWDYAFLKPFDFSAGQPPVLVPVAEEKKDLPEIPVPVYESKPFFGFNEFNVPHYSLMYCNGSTKFFKDIFEEKKKRGIQDVPFWPMKILRDKAAQVLRIPDDNFCHSQYSTKKTVYYTQKLALELSALESVS